MITTTNQLCRTLRYVSWAVVPICVVGTIVASSDSIAIKQLSAVTCVPMPRSQEFRAIEPHLGFVATGLIKFSQELEQLLNHRSVKCRIVATQDGKIIAEEWTSGISASDDVGKLQGWVSVTARPVNSGILPSEVELLLALGANDAVTKAKSVRLHGSVAMYESLTAVVRFDGVGVTIWKCRCRSSDVPADLALKSSDIEVTVSIVCSTQADDKLE